MPERPVEPTDDRTDLATDGERSYQSEAGPHPLTTTIERGRRLGPYESEYEISRGYDVDEKVDELQP